LLWQKALAKLDDAIKQSLDLEERGQVDEALACLDAFLDANSDYDYGRRFARTVAHFRTMILVDAGRYVDAERACEAWAQLGFTRVSQRWAHGFETALTLDALGRTREALAVLEDALGHQNPYPFNAAEKLVTLVELSEQLGQPIDPKWRSLAQDAAEFYGVEMPKHEALDKAILELDEIIEKKKEQEMRGEGKPSAGDGEP
jgi:tetratricopeptide (TPR) repeat protein